MGTSKVQPETGPRGQGVQPSDRVCDVVCLAFCLWTLCSWAVVANGGTLRSLLVPFTALAVVALATVLVGRPRWPALASPTSVAEVAAHGAGLPRSVLAVAGAVALGAAYVIESSASAVASWWWIVRADQIARISTSCLLSRTA